MPSLPIRRRVCNDFPLENAPGYWPRSRISIPDASSAGRWLTRSGANISFVTDSESKTSEKLGGELGLLKGAQGQKWSTPEGFPRMSGVVDSLGKGMHSSTVLLRLDAPVPGSAYIGAIASGVHGHLFLWRPCEGRCRARRADLAEVDRRALPDAADGLTSKRAGEPRFGHD